MLDKSVKLCTVTLTEAYNDLKIGSTAELLSMSKLEQEIIFLKCNCNIREIFYFRGPWNLYR